MQNRNQVRQDDIRVGMPAFIIVIAAGVVEAGIVVVNILIAESGEFLITRIGGQNIPGSQPAYRLVEPIISLRSLLEDRLKIQRDSAG